MGNYDYKITAVAVAAVSLGWFVSSQGWHSSVNRQPFHTESDFVKVEYETYELWVARDETTVGEWALCVSDGECAELGVSVVPDSYPITGVNWKDVSAYLAWYSSVHETKIRLPTYNEWLVFSAEYGPKPKQPIFDDPRLAWAADYDLTALPQDALAKPVGYFGQNSLGISDTRGNVWEWSDSCRLGDDIGVEANIGCFSGRYGSQNISPR